MERTRFDAATLFRDHAPVVARFLRGLGVRRQDCDDMVQEVFLVAHRRGGFTSEHAQPSTWLIGIALRVAFAAGRRKRRSRETFDTDPDVIDAALAPAASPFELMEAAEAQVRLLAALDAMKIDRRALLTSFMMEEQGCEAIAKELGVPVGTVYSRLHKARKVLARILTHGGEQ
jgi:RNA polymerase sigma-70 factor (ECF subfamily)